MYLWYIENHLFCVYTRFRLKGIQTPIFMFNRNL
uniref:Uncharacterized protein n=1 Tax=Myoviridae sp. ctLnO19 TaxID=2825085 RepID=A0A8S5NZL1_9CAUD|nr:MAG TPA: hypothetical protein [Myoviridae sp. ctLnO19]